MAVFRYSRQGLRRHTGGDGRSLDVSIRDHDVRSVERVLLCRRNRSPFLRRFAAGAGLRLPGQHGLCQAGSLARVSGTDRAVATICSVSNLIPAGVLSKDPKGRV